jgi:hypothetical protein
MINSRNIGFLNGTLIFFVSRVFTTNKKKAKSKKIAEDSLLNSPKKSSPFHELKGIKKIPMKTSIFIKCCNLIITKF